MTGRAQEETMMTTGQLASAGSSALEVTAPDETHIPAWPPPVPREIGTLPLSRLRRGTRYLRQHPDQEPAPAQPAGAGYLSPFHFAPLVQRRHGLPPPRVRGRRAHH